MNKILTRNGITYDLANTPYKLTVKYDVEDLTYHFSSQLYLDKFKSKLEEYRSFINDSLTKRFNFDIKYNMLADIRLYTVIEKRGFFIVNEKEQFNCLNIIRLDGLQMTTKNLQE